MFVVSFFSCCNCNNIKCTTLLFETIEVFIFFGSIFEQEAWGLFFYPVLANLLAIFKSLLTSELYIQIWV